MTVILLHLFVRTKLVQQWKKKNYFASMTILVQYQVKIIQNEAYLQSFWTEMRTYSPQKRCIVVYGSGISQIFRHIHRNLEI